MAQSKFKITPLKIILFFLFLGLFGTCSEIFLRLLNPIWADGIVKHHINEYSQFVPYSSKENIFIDYSDQANFLVIGKDGLFINGSFDKYTRP